MCLRKPSLAPLGPPSTREEKISGLIGVLETLALFFLVIGGLTFGWFSPTQAGGALSAGVLLLALIRRTITWEGIINALRDSVRISCMIMFIIAAGIIFGRFIAITRIPIMLSDWLVGLPISPMAIMVLIMVIYLIGGCFMDGMALLTLTIPIIFPAVVGLGFDPIWFGVAFVVVGEMGCITPPVGINVYVIKGVAPDVPLGVIFRGIFPFLFALAICLILLMAFPQIATFLPSVIEY
jgi:tripartite ATP-independent transporter DctM subunit